jgi:branched-chain amino acid transport system permease protein
MYVALAEAWNLLGGYAGYINFGSVIFLGLGAYTTAIASTATGLTPLATAPLAALVAALAAVLIAGPAFRLRGDYFAVATFVLTLGLQQFAAVLGVTGGAFGRYLRPTVSSLDGAVRLFFFAFLGLAVLSVAVCFALERTRWFSALVAIREDEDAAEVLGVPTFAVKVALLVVGAVIAGLAGCVYAAQLGYIEPTGTFDFNVSLAVVVGVVLGGMGTWYGPIVGAVIAELIAQELFTRVQGVWNQIAFGALLMVVVLVAPRGLTVLGRRRSGRRFGV